MFNIGGVFQIFDDFNSEVRLKISTGGNIQIPADNKKFEVLINIDDAFTYITKQPEKPLLLTDEVVDKKQAS